MKFKINNFLIYYMVYIITNRKGAVYEGRPDLNPVVAKIAKITNKRGNKTRNKRGNKRGDKTRT